MRAGNDLGEPIRSGRLVGWPAKWRGVSTNTPHRGCCNWQADPLGTQEIPLLASSCSDLDAAWIALGYKFRWTVELFFRWFKCILGCQHLLSTCENGVVFQVYMALIASLVITVWTGHKSTKRTFEMICHYFSGWATENELLAHI